MGGINTAVLIVSSLTMAMAVHESHSGNKKGIMVYLILTGILGLTFLVIKYLNIPQRSSTVLVPGLVWHPHGEYSPQLALFLFPVFRNDRHARAAHGRRHWPVDLGVCQDRTGDVHSGIQCLRLKFLACIGTLSISSGFSCFPLLYLLGTQGGH